MSKPNKKVAVRKPVTRQKIASPRKPQAQGGMRAAKKAMGKSAPISASVGRFLASSLANAIPGGSPFSSLAGSAGSWIGNKIGTALGLGDYKVRSNSILSEIKEGNSPPAMHNLDDEIVLRHREYLGDVFSSPVAGEFSVQNFSINPGLPASFPWLSQVAKAFREWTPRGMIYEFKSNTGFVSNASTPAVGMVIMATDYNAFEVNPFANKREMENNAYTTSAKSTESFYHPIECDSERNVLQKFFLRSGEIPTAQPPQLYDLGVFAIASVGQPTPSQNLGELWCTVEIGLSKATLQNFADNESPTDLFVTGNPIFGALTENGGQTVCPRNSLGGVLKDVATQSIYYFPPTRVSGTFLAIFYCSGIQTAAQQIALITMAGAHNCISVPTELQIGPNPISTQPTFVGGATQGGAPPPVLYAPQTMVMWRIKVTGPGAFFTFESNAPLFNATGGGLFTITPVSAAVAFSPMLGTPFPPRSKLPALKSSAHSNSTHQVPEDDDDDLYEHLTTQFADMVTRLREAESKVCVVGEILP